MTDDRVKERQSEREADRERGRERERTKHKSTKTSCRMKAGEESVRERARESEGAREREQRERAQRVILVVLYLDPGTDKAEPDEDVVVAVTWQGVGVLSSKTFFYMSLNASE